ncbi:MAG TPA: LysR substrate-binding domain-containing protein [Kofleriaceae bacterium]|nr:LysR substrate-binding domain-containing protein [Kofleriaceae bacterium]
MNQLDSLRAAVAAADAGSLSAAARSLSVPLATLSRKVAELEAHLGTALFVRTSRALQITEAGQGYLAVARRVLDELASADRGARGEYDRPRGELAIAAPIVFGRLHVLPIVGELLRTYPEITVRLVLSDRYANLIDDHFDVAVRIGELVDSALVATRVGAVRRVLCASPAYLAEHGRPRRPADLARHDCIATTDGAWQFASTSVAIRPRLFVSTAEAAIDAARAGLGIARVLSYQLNDPSLVRVLGSHEPPALPVHLVRSNALVPRKLRVFLDLATTQLRAALS